MHCQYILQLSLLTLLSLPGTHFSGTQTWSVWYHDRDRTTVICASKGSSVVFACTYSYPDTMEVRRKIWFTPRGKTKQDGSQQGDGVFNTSGLTNKTRYSGRTEFYDQGNNCTLKLNNVTEDDSGRFFFRFEANKHKQAPQGYTGPLGVALTISVLSLKLNENGPVKERDHVTLACTSTCNLPQMEFLWFKDGCPLPGVSGVLGGQYPLGPLSSNDTGCYSCGLGQGMSTPILLDVRYAPRNVSVQVSPSPEVVKGSRLTLTCNNNANPAAETYTWFQRTGTLTSLRLGMGKEHTFKEIDSDDSGLYFCMAQNALGSQNSTELELKVKESAHLMVFLAAFGALFLVTAVIVVLYIYIKRRKWNRAEKKLPTKPVPQLQKATFSRPEDIYENMRRSAKPITDPDVMNYTELNIRPAPSHRRQLNNKAEDDDAVVYSQLQTQ
ncbi:B-cell receptor CD22-like isoform X1 [Salvelinus namaycush]|uniref:B-cell receptor CD22-like isoform X1 n=1 Tax=Salvelinus namaycush TaxID=8040 RepID=A0A8U0UF85_SALNM|nr:B-cell receptor CD22-like isoform X1 [Salvelinus namaycush]